MRIAQRGFPIGIYLEPLQARMLPIVAVRHLAVSSASEIFFFRLPALMPGLPLLQTRFSISLAELRVGYAQVVPLAAIVLASWRLALALNCEHVKKRQAKCVKLGILGALDRSYSMDSRTGLE